MMKQANQFLINNMLAQKVNVSKTSTKDPEIIEAWLKSGKDLTVTAMDGTMRLWLKFGVVWMEDRCSVADPLYDGRYKQQNIMDIPFDEFMEKWVYKNMFEFSLVN